MPAEKKTRRWKYEVGERRFMRRDLAQKYADFAGGTVYTLSQGGHKKRNYKRDGKQVVTVRGLNKDYLAQIRNEALAEGRTTGEVLNEILGAYLGA